MCIEESIGTDIFYLALSNGFLEYKDNVIQIIAQEAHIGVDEVSAKKHLMEVRKERIEQNKKESADFTKQESELVENLRKAKAGRL